MIIKLLIDGGDMKPGPGIAQQLGPLGINIGKVISEVNKATEGFKGIKVPVELDINTSTKNFKITVKSPPVPELIKKEIGAEKGSGDHKNNCAGNIAIERIISIAKIKKPEMLEKTLKSAVKTIVGSCVSLGVLVESKSPAEVEKEIDAGKYDKEIISEKTEVSDEKKKELDDYFKSLQLKQQAAAQAIKAQEEAKETQKTEAGAEEAKKEEPKKEAGKEAKKEVPKKEAGKKEIAKKK